MSQPVFKRILLKLSGEALMGKQGFGVDPEVASRIAAEVTEVRQMGVQVAMVVGGGNFIRGVAASAMGIDRVVADNMGMLATDHQRPGPARRAGEKRVAYAGGHGD